MKIEPGEQVWISVKRSVAPAEIVEVECARQQMVRLRDASGAFVIRSVHELYATERAALEARIHEDEHWAVHYGVLADEAAIRARQLRVRLTQLQQIPLPARRRASPSQPLGRPRTAAG